MNNSIRLTAIDENDGDRSGSIECSLCGIGQVIDVIGHLVDHCTRRAIRILAKRPERERKRRSASIVKDYLHNLNEIGSKSTDGDVVQCRR